MPLTAAEILADFDDDASEQAAFFPDFDHGYHYHVDARLSAYGDGNRWVVIIEQLAVNPRAGGVGGVHTTLYYHGNAICLTAQPGWGDHPVQTIINFGDAPGEPVLLLHSEEVNPKATHASVRGHVLPITTDPNYYWARKIDVESMTNEQLDEWIAQARQVLAPEQAEEKVRWYEEELRPKVGRFELNTWHLLRGMVPEHRELLLATEEERRRGVPAGLPRLLLLDDWEHPRLLEGELPRSSHSFKSLARVLASADPSHYDAPAEGGNVHWSNWPHSGNL